MAKKVSGNAYSNPAGVDYGWSSFVNNLKTDISNVTYQQDKAVNNYEKKTQSQVFDEWNNYTNSINNFEQSVTSLSGMSSGNASFDEQVRQTFNAEADGLYEAAKEAAAGNITSQQYKQIERDAKEKLANTARAMPILVSQGQDWIDGMSIEPGNYGAVSSTMPTEAQIVLSNLAKQNKGPNDPPVTLQFVGNTPSLFVPGKEEGTGAMMNLNAVYADAQKGKDLVPIIDNYSTTLTGAYKNVFQPANTDSKYITTYYEPDPNDPTKEIAYQTITDKGRQEGIDAMIRLNQFDGMLNNNELMRMIWQDQMPDEITGDVTWHATDPSLSAEENKAMLQEQRDKAARFLAEKAFDENATAYQVGKRVGKRNKPTDAGVGDGTGTGANDSPGANFGLDAEASKLVETINAAFNNPQAKASKLEGMKIGDGTIDRAIYNPETNTIDVYEKQVYDVYTDTEKDGEVSEGVKTVTRDQLLGSYTPQMASMLAQDVQKQMYGGSQTNLNQIKNIPNYYNAVQKQYLLDRTRDQMLMKKYDEAADEGTKMWKTYMQFKKDNPLPPQYQKELSKRLNAIPEYKKGMKMIEENRDNPLIKADNKQAVGASIVTPYYMQVHKQLLDEIKEAELNKLKG
jgi:hypothetical protein